MSTTSRDLMIVTLDVVPSRPVEPGELSLALAGAEAIDLLRAEALALDGDQRILPRPAPALADRLLDDAAQSLVHERPYESLEDWLWRRGRGLSSAYLAALKEDGQVTWQRSRRVPFRGRTVLNDTAGRRRAAARWAADEPVLLALAEAVGIRGAAAETDPGATEEPVLIVLATVHDAVMELDAVRRRRAIEDAAFANVWRGA